MRGKWWSYFFIWTRVEKTLEWLKWDTLWRARGLRKQIGKIENDKQEKRETEHHN